MFENVKLSYEKVPALGVHFEKDRIHFGLFSKNATSVTLGLFQNQEVKEIALQRKGDVWFVTLDGVPSGALYAYKCSGPYDEKQGHLFKADRWLVDPYAKAIAEGKGLLNQAEFDWQGISSPRISKEDLIIYEAHLKGFTRDPSSGVSAPGTFLGMIDKIPHLKKLGINAVELLPIFAFNEFTGKVHPTTKQPLPNYWGYQPLHFFAPMPSYGTVNDFKTLVRELHRNHIEVILDVVYNHTGEGNSRDFAINLRGIDNAVYYQMNPEGAFLDYTGCGNTFNCNHPIVQQLIIDSLRYWVEEMHVDGFRFDLAAVLTRDVNGNPLEDPPLLKAMEVDPILKQVKLIAEPWDAAGLNLQGYFGKRSAWSEWNGFFKEEVRQFIKGDEGQAGFFANVLSGSKMKFSCPRHSINFVTAHDGFTLRDLTTYNTKKNEENGDHNEDGETKNFSWNCGAEGPVEEPLINRLRERQQRNFLIALFLAQGIPMLLMGDEYGHSRGGNNNAYCQDNRLNWFLWDKLNENEVRVAFVSALIQFRKSHSHFHTKKYLTKKHIAWHGSSADKPDWGTASKLVICTLKEKHEVIYFAFNASAQKLNVKLPEQSVWHLICYTENDWGNHHLADPYSAPTVKEIGLESYSSCVAISKIK